MNSPLPALQQHVLNEETLNSLVQDLSALATILEVRAKGESRRHANAGAFTFADAVGSLLDGKLRGVQVHYLYDQREWSDTLIASPTGIRLTRICLSDARPDDAEDGCLGSY